MNRVSYIIFTAAFFSMLASCTPRILGGRKSNKKPLAGSKDTTTAKLVSTPPTAMTYAPVPTPGKAALIAELTPLWAKRLKFKTLSGKAKIGLEGPDLSHELVANYRIAKDSIIWVHVTALGGIVSVARIYVTPDSFYMLNYQQKEATKIALSDVGKILPVPVKFRQLQSLFTGDPLADGSITSAEVKDSTWSIHTEDASYVQDVAYKRNDSTLALGFLKTRDPNGPTAVVNYNTYEHVDNRLLSTDRTVHIQNGLKNYTVDLNLVNPEFDKKLEYPFSIPGNYTLKTGK